MLLLLDLDLLDDLEAREDRAHLEDVIPDRTPTGLGLSVVESPAPLHPTEHQVAEEQADGFPDHEPEAVAHGADPESAQRSPLIGGIVRPVHAEERRLAELMPDHLLEEEVQHPSIPVVSCT